MPFKDSYSKVCAICQRQFIAKNARAKYCSEKCRRETCRCVFCGKEFLRERHTTGKYCSPKCWYEWNKAGSKKECLICGKVFQPTHQRQKTCSHKCANEAKRVPRKFTNCLECGTPIGVKKPKKQKFCSKSCSAKRKSHKGTREGIGSVASAGNGYIRIKVGSGYPGASKKGWMLEHRYVMQKQLGRLIEAHERVHHKNGKRDDNRFENLELWTVGKKDPAGQRQLDVVKEAIKKLPDNDKRELIQWINNL